MAKVSERFDTILRQIDYERLFSIRDFYVLMEAYDDPSRSNVRNLIHRRVRQGVLIRAVEEGLRYGRYCKPAVPEEPAPERKRRRIKAGTMAYEFDEFLKAQKQGQKFTLEDFYDAMGVGDDRKGMANVRKLVLRRVRAGVLGRDARAFYGGHKTTLLARYATFHIPAKRGEPMKLW